MSVLPLSANFGPRPPPPIMMNASDPPKPFNPLSSLLRYELLVLLVWFCVEIGRWYGKNKAYKKIQEEEESGGKVKGLSLRKTMCWGVLIGAVVGVFLFWLITYVLFYNTFYSPVVNINQFNPPIIGRRR
jgi:hypothetical protein